MLLRIALALALTLAAGGLARRSHRVPYDEIRIPVLGGTLVHRAHRYVSDPAPPFALTLESPAADSTMLYATLLWRTDPKDPWFESPMGAVAGRIDKVFESPALPFEEGTIVEYRIVLSAYGRALEIPAKGHLSRRHTGSAEKGRIRWHAGFLLLGLFVAVVSGLDAVSALGKRTSPELDRLVRRIVLESGIAAVLVAAGVVASFPLVSLRGLDPRTLTPPIAACGILTAAASLALLATARAGYRVPAAIASLLAAVVTLAVSLLPHSF